MRQFMDKDFLLTTPTSRWLYHEVAKNLPIIDYHCHIPVQEIAEDRKFKTITEVWLGADHYKWRVMRAAGITEDLITGDASDREKFKAFASVMPKLIGNPIYHWSHLELQRAFDIYEPLNSKNADEIYDKCNEILKGYSARSLIDKFNVKALCTTDDPIDNLHWHKMIAADDSMSAKVLPAFRPDKAINIEKSGFYLYIKNLEKVWGKAIWDVNSLIEALLCRIDYFDANGCICADHGMDYCMYIQPDKELADQAFKMAMNGKTPTKAMVDAYKMAVTIACAKKYKELNWVMQIHFGVLRNTNDSEFDLLGSDSGYDAINSKSGVENLAPLLNVMKNNQGLPKLIVYSLCPTDNTAIDTVIACFQGDGCKGKIQHGSAWWFNDSRPGMRNHLTELATNGVLGCFVGMLTDSRSFLSYTRHEYFRRVVCELFGEWVESGQYPEDKGALSELVRDLCFNNTNNYFGF